VGATRKLTNASGTVTDSHAFDAFGNLQTRRVRQDSGAAPMN